MQGLDKQHELVRGVEPVDVQRGIGLGVAFSCCFGEGRGEVDALLVISERI